MELAKFKEGFQKYSTVESAEQNPSLLDSFSDKLNQLVMSTYLKIVLITSELYELTTEVSCEIGVH